ncbi:hypothetical protein [Streptomyces californicus]|uniref:hypothetical protein n=1 Tax=Streptomyces californicus TaxID=67351 RepID=UPI003324BF6B
MNNQPEPPDSQHAHGQRLVRKTLHAPPEVFPSLHSHGSAEEELAKLVVNAARQVDTLQSELADRCTWTARDLSHVATGTSSANPLGILQGSGTQIDILSARRSDAIAHLKSVMAAYQKATTAPSPQPPHRK